MTKIHGISRNFFPVIVIVHVFFLMFFFKALSIWDPYLRKEGFCLCQCYFWFFLKYPSKLVSLLVRAGVFNVIQCDCSWPYHWHVLYNTVTCLLHFWAKQLVLERMTHESDREYCSVMFVCQRPDTSLNSVWPNVCLLQPE